MQIERTSDTFPIKRNFADAILEWGARLAHAGWIAERGGSLGYRHALGFVITREGADLSHPSDSDLVCVERWDWDTGLVKTRGKQSPSGHVFVHAAVCQERASAIFTFVADGARTMALAEKSGRPTTSPIAGATPRQIFEACLGCFGKGNLILIPGVGVLSFGCTADDAGSALLQLGDA